MFPRLLFAVFLLYLANLSESIRINMDATWDLMSSLGMDGKLLDYLRQTARKATPPVDQFLRMTPNQIGDLVYETMAPEILKLYPEGSEEELRILVQLVAFVEMLSNIDVNEGTCRIDSDSEQTLTTCQSPVKYNTSNGSSLEDHLLSATEAFLQQIPISKLGAFRQFATEFSGNS